MCLDVCESERRTKIVTTLIAIKCYLEEKTGIEDVVTNGKGDDISIKTNLTPCQVAELLRKNFSEIKTLNIDNNDNLKSDYKIKIKIIA